jgi:hypothetical protein
MSGRPLADVFPAYVTIALPPAVLYDPTTHLPTPITSRTIPTDTNLPPGSAHYDKARVIIFNGGVFVFVDSTARPGTAERVLALPLPPNTLPRGVASRTSDATVTTANGTTLAWSRNPGCGCGSRLRSFNPYSDGRTLALP